MTRPLARILLAGCLVGVSADHALSGEPDAATATAPAPDATTEYWAGGFYRAPGGAATLQLPDYDVRNWSHQLYDWNGARVLVLYKGTAKSFRAKLTFIFYPPADGDAKPKDLVKSLLDRTIKSAPYLEQTAYPRESETKVGKSATAAAAGTDKNGVKIEVIVMAFADGKHAVASLVQASEKEMRAADLQEFTTALVSTLRVGSRVSQPFAPAAPATPVEGVYEGPDHAYLIFDRRGYASREAPINDLRLDLPTLSQASPDAVTAYQADKGTLTAAWGDDKIAAKVKGDVITVGDAKYHRVDGKKALSPKGAYEAQGHSWVFDGGATVTADGQPYTYRIEGDHLWLDLAGGAISRPFFSHAKGDGTLTDDVLHIGARTYVRMETK